MVKPVYLNKKQYELISSFQAHKVKTAVGVCGRGMGKSTIAGEYIDRCRTTMPRSRGFIGGPTKESITNKILPSMQEHWERIGVIEGKDYVVGKMPPKEWDTPKNKVNDFKNVISFENGCALSMVSMYKEGGGRGPSFQFGMADEAGFFKRENFAANIMPAMRGLRWDIARLLIEAEHVDMMGGVPFGRIEQNGLDLEWVIPFSENPYYLSMLLLTSMPWTDTGKWILDYEHNKEAFYLEGTALDNLEVLGPQYIPNLQTNMTDLEFRIEVMNERLEQSENSFYHNWNDEKHIIDRDPYRKDLPLEISFDFGQFMCMTVSQAIDNVAYTIRAFYVKNGSMGDLMDQFTQWYQDHPVKDVHITGDVSGNRSRNPETDNRSLYDEIIDYLRVHGWNPIHMPRRYNPAHAEKHLILNKALEEKKASGLPAVRMYSDGCQPLIISMKKAEAKDQLQKDKSSEHPKSGVAQEEATHFSDAWDYWYMSRFGHLYNNAGVSSIGLSIG